MMKHDPYPHGYGHRPHDEDGVTFDDPWLWELSPEEIADRWRQGAADDSTPR